MVGRICPPPGGDRVNVSENLGATSVAPVAPVDTSLSYINIPYFLVLYRKHTCLLSKAVTGVNETIKCFDFIISIALLDFPKCLLL